MSTSRQAGTVHTVPTDRLPGRRQLLVFRSVCLTASPFSKHDLEVATGVPAERAALVMRFACATALATRAPGRGMYQASDLALSIAPQWRRSDDDGYAALGRLWSTSWFAKAAKARLTAGPESRLRSSLAAHLLTRAHLDERSLGCTEVLVDLMIATGLIARAEPGYVTWADQGAERSHGPGAAIPTQQTPSTHQPDRDTPEDEPQDRDADGRGHDNRTTFTGTEEADTDAFTAGDNGQEAAEPPSHPTAATEGAGDMLALLTRTWRFADLIRLTEKEVISLHRSLHGLVHAANRLAGLDPAGERPK